MNVEHKEAELALLEGKTVSKGSLLCRFTAPSFGDCFTTLFFSGGLALWLVR